MLQPAKGGTSSPILVTLGLAHPPASGSEGQGGIFSSGGHFYNLTRVGVMWKPELDMFSQGPFPDRHPGLSSVNA